MLFLSCVCVSGVWFSLSLSLCDLLIFLGEEGEEAKPRAGAKAAAAGPASGTGKYVPPALRGVDTADAARNRQLRGLLNRLSENNLTSVAAQIGELVAQGRQRPMLDELVRYVYDHIYIYMYIYIS